MSSKFSERNHLMKGLDAVADAFSGTVASDVFNMENFESAVGIIHKGVGATGTSTITVLACDDAAGTNPVAIPFSYRAITSGDTPGTLTAATASGFTTTAGSSQLYVVEINAEDFTGSAAGKAWCYIQAVEVVDSPVLGGIILIGREPKFAAPFATAIA